ncbi:MAG: 1-deoxy-D-xylulose-5-phosphate synthase [Clostridiales Family XIII bacterium]|jgi:1-deoxy-D-xylulose-5-phosphate synthase|nr:1-deoxy-D-xylulose-5-phosphate synthase [Clostridiales Family XIII bacterium]
MKNFQDLNLPEEIHELDIDDLSLLTYEIRDRLIETVANNGGHLASNLGIVELTLALLKVFDPSEDAFVFDVGHQAYVYKMLTGRVNDFEHLRHYGGISGFPKRDESPYDYYDSGHASSSISAALGIAKGRNIQGIDGNTIAIMGDGAMTGGMVYEGLLNLGSLGGRLIVVINDNEKSIGNNIKSMHQHLANLRASKTYRSLKETIKHNITSVPAVGVSLSHGIESVKNLVKYSLTNGSIFEEFGIKYYGPVDGHNIKELIEIFSAVKDIKFPIVVHTVTKKGKGYINAEKDPAAFHGIGPFEIETGKVLGSKKKSFSRVTGEVLCDLAEENHAICAITAAMRDGTGLAKFSDEYPNQFFDVGIAEEHAVTFAAGLALTGLRPYVCVYSTFLQRAYDQIMIDVAMQKQDVTFLIDRAGLVGEDGETHHGLYDIAYMRSVPGMTVMAPSNVHDYAQMLIVHSKAQDGPISIRIPRAISACPTELTLIQNAYDNLEIGKSVKIVKNIGSKIEIWALGSMVPQAIIAAKILSESGVAVDVVDARYVKPFDAQAVDLAISEGRSIVTIEDGMRSGGFGEAIAAYVASASADTDSKILDIIAYDDEFITHGSLKDLYIQCGVDAQGIADRIVATL